MKKDSKSSKKMPMGKCATKPSYKEPMRPMKPNTTKKKK